MDEELTALMAAVRAAGYDPYIALNTALLLGENHRVWLAPTLRQEMPDLSEPTIRWAWAICTGLLDQNVYKLPEGY